MGTFTQCEFPQLLCSGSGQSVVKTGDGGSKDFVFGTELEFLGFDPYDTKMCTTLHVYFTKKKIRFIGKSYTGNRPIVARRMYNPKVPSPLRVKLNRAQSGLITVHKGISSPNIFIELDPAALNHLPKN